MKEMIRMTLEQAVHSLQEGGALLFSGAVPSVEVSFPKDEAHGDFVSNIALVLAREVKVSPLDVAKMFKESLEKSGALKQFHVTVAPPGYLNFLYTEEALSKVIATVNEQGGEYGSQKKEGMHHPVLLEYISANPTGPLHIGNARGGFFGDALARVLKKAGCAVSTEYYVNDAGEQVVKLGHSVLGDGEAVYGGEYIDELRRQITNYKLQITNVKEVGEWAAEVVLEEYIKKTISERMNISFDAFVSEKEDIVEAGYVDRAIAFFKEKDLTYEEEGALWLRTTNFGDDKDRVLVKASGEKTYFASDCGYILHKKERGFARLIEVWGADHHGYVARFRAAAEALGFEKDGVKFVLVQMVRLMKDGQEVRMSKRAGNVVTIDDLLDRVGVDVARFFFLLYSPDTHMNFDLGLAEERSQKNPVYYVQYAHARMASIFKKAEEELGMTNDELRMMNDESGVKNENFVFEHGKEQLLIRHLAKFPEVIEGAAEELTVHRLPQYAIRLADIFHSFYDACVVINPEDEETTRARLALVRATKTVLAETFRLLGVSAPERM